jgi:CBS domain-containing protein
LLFLFALVAHEIVRQRQWGWPARGHLPVELLLIGGASDSPEAPPAPRAEVTGALAGLAILSTGAGITWYSERLLHRSASPAVNAIQTLAVALVAVTIINAMPGFPLDGGHILRAWLWYLTDDLVLATRLAAVYGSLIAMALIMTGALLLLDSDQPYWGFGAGVAGFQLHGIARRSLRRARWAVAGATLLLREAVPYPPRVPSGATVAEAVDLLLSGPAESFLLVMDEDVPVGIVRLAELRGTHRAKWDQMAVEEVMTPLGDLPRLSADLTVPEALAQLAGRASAALVQDGDRPLGVITHHDLMTALADRAARPDEPPRSPVRPE